MVQGVPTAFIAYLVQQIIQNAFRALRFEDSDLGQFSSFIPQQQRIPLDLANILLFCHSLNEVESTVVTGVEADEGSA